MDSSHNTDHVLHKHDLKVIKRPGERKRLFCDPLAIAVQLTQPLKPKHGKTGRRLVRLFPAILSVFCLQSERKRIVSSKYRTQDFFHFFCVAICFEQQPSADIGGGTADDPLHIQDLFLCFCQIHLLVPSPIGLYFPCRQYTISR